jgi:hypothetical protein
MLDTLFGYLQERLSYLDIGEVGADDTVHNTPDVGNGVLVVNLDAELLTDKAAGTLPNEYLI